MNETATTVDVINRRNFAGCMTSRRLLGTPQYLLLNSCRADVGAIGPVVLERGACFCLEAFLRRVYARFVTSDYTSQVMQNDVLGAESSRLSWNLKSTISMSRARGWRGKYTEIFHSWEGLSDILLQTVLNSHEGTSCTFEPFAGESTCKYDCRLTCTRWSKVLAWFYILPE